MYTFEKRDHGLLAIHPNGKAVAHVETSTITEIDPGDKDFNPNLKVQPKRITKLPREKWWVHFTAFKFVEADLVTFVAELATQEG